MLDCIPINIASTLQCMSNGKRARIPKYAGDAHRRASRDGVEASQGKNQSRRIILPSMSYGLKQFLIASRAPNADRSGKGGGTEQGDANDNFKMSLSRNRQMRLDSPEMQFGKDCLLVHFTLRGF